MNDSGHKIKLEVETLNSCPLCGSRRFVSWRSGRDLLYRLTDQLFEYSRCLNCDLRFMSTRPRERDAYLLYPIDAYEPYQQQTYEPPTPPGNRPLPGFVPRRVLRWVVERLFADSLPEALRDLYTPDFERAVLLDFGCGSDCFLNWARHQGWQTIGMDVSERVIRSVRRSGHQAFLINDGSWKEIPDGSLALVRMNHVLEHSYRSKDILTRSFAKLATGGRIHIATPNPRGISSIFFRSMWFSLDCPRHTMLFPPSLLTRLLHQIGFKHLRVVQETVTKDAARSIGHFLHDRGRIAHERIGRMATHRAMNQALFLPGRLAAALGMADRFHCIAEK